ncbi:hypothetical protein [Sulfurimonas sp.]|uniref:hypothetical protein n=1 Tax=Sulfurimonas sp. TaxID=2022749 RepID=UPI002AB16593|nr:hypothetical protein [Sulfurimonas sp.]
MPINTDQLKSKILEAQTNSDIASLYILEEKASEMFDEDTLGAFYTNILDMALERLTDALEAPRKMDLNEVQDFATLRALYEYAMEYYHANNIKDASALFEVLSGLSNDEKFSSALKFHWIASKENLSLDDFMDKLADMDATQNAGTFYISAFTKEAQKLLDKSQIKGEQV